MSDILTTADVMQRYKCERQTAAKIMKDAFAFRIGNRLYVREDDLENYEDSRREYPVSRTKRTAVQPVAKIPRRRA